jgi:nicotinate-nucleotide adenylyltransferase
LLHGKVGAFLAKDKYHITDDALCHAIAVHTTGVPNMSLLDKIIFVADYIEPHRNTAPRLAELRKMAYEDLDTCVYMILEDTISYLSERQTAEGGSENDAEDMDPITMETYQYYKENRK